MKQWEELEDICYKYVSENYKKGDISFIKEGSSDSTKSDIYVSSKTTHRDFYIETKSPLSQCGQFVLFPDMKQKRFVFSQQNKVSLTPTTNQIIDILNSDFSYYSSDEPTKDLPNKYKDLYWKWVIEWYKHKNTRFVITYSNDDFIIFPLEKFPDYFNISGVYRVKKSGSTELPSKYLDEVKKRILELSPRSYLTQIGKKTYLHNYNNSEYRLNFFDYDVFLSEKESCYELRKLSNTFNSNVIFTIQLNGKQQKEDIELFERELRSL